MRKTAATPDSQNTAEVRARILETAGALFYQRGVRAVGVDLAVEKAGMAKTSLYRHFGTKDDLIAAFLEREDADFWGTWDLVAGQNRDDAAAELDAHLGWIGERVGRPNYRGARRSTWPRNSLTSIIRRARLPPPTSARCASG
jgi:AcrR family transcriptional regulator